VVIPGGYSFQHEIFRENVSQESSKSPRSSNTGQMYFHCTICRDGFSSRSLLQEHVQRHVEEKPLEFRTPGKSYACQLGLQTGKEMSRCHMCGLKLSHSGNLKRHLLTHMGKKSFECDICGKLFSHSAHVKDHILTHTEVRAFKCDSCDRAFLKSEHLE